jgi:sugar O-acyltransferase (sialic acid O-acetyltransferase NeuD family)
MLDDVPMELALVGAGGVGREALDAVMAGGNAVSCFIDERLAGQEVRGLPVVLPGDANAAHRFLVAIADPSARSRLAEGLLERGHLLTQVLHPRATVAPECVLGTGLLVLAGAYVSSSVTMGRQCQIHYNATVGHDCHFGERVTIYPGANVAGSVVLGDDVTVGSGAVVLQGLRVGARAFVGAGAVVTHDVASDTVVVGSPARPLVR